MAIDGKHSVSAQVVLHPEGTVLGGGADIRTRNLGEFLPSAESIRRATEFFAARGFEVGPVVGISFSITGAVELFEGTFNVALQQDDKGGLKAARPDGTAGYELPLNALPEDLTKTVAAVTFTPPPDFGPSAYFS